MRCTSLCVGGATTGKRKSTIYHYSWRALMNRMKPSRLRVLRYLISIPLYVISLVGVLEVFMYFNFLEQTPAPLLLLVYFLVVVGINYTLFDTEIKDKDSIIFKLFSPLFLRIKSPRFLYLCSLLKFSLAIFFILIITLLFSVSQA